MRFRCSAHSQVIGQMERIRKGDDISYYFQMRAFKFPGESDVYFFCSVDLSADYNFPELCPRKARFIRMLRQHPDGITELKLYDNVKVVLSEELKPEPVKGWVLNSALWNFDVQETCRYRKSATKHRKRLALTIMISPLSSQLPSLWVSLVQ